MMATNMSVKDFIVSECKALGELQKLVMEELGIDLFDIRNHTHVKFIERFNKLFSLMDVVTSEDRPFKIASMVAGSGDERRYFITRKRHISRNEFLDYLRYVDINDVGITQESTRRTQPLCVHTKEDLIQVLRYFQMINSGVPLEQARDTLLNTIPTNVIMSQWEKYSEFDGITPMTEFSDVIEINPLVVDFDYSAKLDTFEVTNIPVLLKVGAPEGAIHGAASVYRKDTTGLDVKYINAIAGKGHFSILEHIPVYFKTKMSIGAFNQLIRHRHVKSNVIDETGDVNDNLLLLPLGTIVDVESFTTLRGLMNITNERTCTHAQDEIRSLFLSIIDMMLKLDIYTEIVSKFFGPRCVAKQFNCLDPKSCETKKKETVISVRENSRLES